MLKNELEALLFSSGRKMDIEELSQLTKSKMEEIKAALVELKMEYDEKNSSQMLVNEGNGWKLTVREQYLPLVRKIVTETELSKTVLETLAVIAFKYPIKQSELIKIRTNKSYEHLNQLEEMGYITRQKHGRTNLIKLAQKFFEYFDLPEERLREVFKDFSSIAKAIEEKEVEIKKLREEQKARAEEDKKKLGNLEVVDEPSEEELEKERERIKQIKEEDKKISEEKEKIKDKKKEELGIGIKLTPEEERLVDEKVESILHPKEEESKEGRESEGKSIEESKDLLEAEMQEKEKE